MDMVTAHTCVIIIIVLSWSSYIGVLSIDPDSQPMYLGYLSYYSIIGSQARYVCHVIMYAGNLNTPTQSLESVFKQRMET